MFLVIRESGALEESPGVLANTRRFVRPVGRRRGTVAPPARAAATGFQQGRRRLRRATCTGSGGQTHQTVPGTVCESEETLSSLAAGFSFGVQQGSG